MSAYIYFTESVVYFTPSAVTLNGHEHVTISVSSAPAAITRHNRNDARTGRRETLVRIPCNFTGKFVVTVATDYPKRQKNADRIHRLGVTVKKGVIIGVTDLGNDRLPYVEVSFPSGYWGELGTNWSASDWEVWVDLPSGWGDNE
jgi:hypothetical protein